MHYLALTLPDFKGNAVIPTPPGFAGKGSELANHVGPNGSFDLGGLISAGLTVVFYAAGFLLFGLALFGIVQYIFAQGKKDRLEKARNRITYAFIGFIIIALSMAIKDYLQGIIFPGADSLNNQNVTDITPPPQVNTPKP